jgi:hypothetical protein
LMNTEFQSALSTGLLPTCSTLKAITLPPGFVCLSRTICRIGE